MTAALIAKLESASEGSRGLDAEIARALGWSVHNARRNGLRAVTDGRAYDDLNPLDDNAGILIALGAYTTSIDAALALAERAYPDWDWIVGRTNGGLTVHCQFGGKDFVFANTPALAICAALLRASAAEGAG